MTRHAIWTIGVGQCVSWGVLYYAFGVLLIPLERELDAAGWLIAGAFSCALLSSALAAPTVGTLVDRGQGPAVMQAGGLIAAGLLVVWAAVPNLWTSYIIWTALGACMASVLYESAFAIVGRAVDDGAARVRAIATITVLGGLASTVFLPVTAWLVNELGWRGCVVALALCLATVTVLTQRVVFRTPASGVPEFASGSDAQRSPSAVSGTWKVVLVFSCSSFVSAAIATNLVQALGERGISTTTGATLAGLLGVMQLPGRLLVMNRRFSPSPTQLVWFSLGLQTAGLISLVVGSTIPLTVLGVSLFAAGSGLSTVARPFLVLVTYGALQSGRVNGVVSRAQQFARAGGPIAAAYVASVVGYRFAMALLALVIGGAAAVLVARAKPELVRSAA